MQHEKFHAGCFGKVQNMFSHIKGRTLRMLDEKPTLYT